MLCPASVLHPTIPVKSSSTTPWNAGTSTPANFPAPVLRSTRNLPPRPAPITRSSQPSPSTSTHATPGPNWLSRRDNNGCRPKSSYPASTMLMPQQLAHVPKHRRKVGNRIHRRRNSRPSLRHFINPVRRRTVNHTPPTTPPSHLDPESVAHRPRRKHPHRIIPRQIPPPADHLLTLHHRPPRHLDLRPDPLAISPAPAQPHSHPRRHTVVAQHLQLPHSGCSRPRPNPRPYPYPQAPCRWPHPPRQNPTRD